MEDRKRVNDEENNSFTVFAEWGTRIRCARTRMGIHQITPPRKTSDCDLLQMTRDALGAVAEQIEGTFSGCGDFTAIESSGYSVLFAAGSWGICIAVSQPHCDRRLSFR